MCRIGHLEAYILISIFHFCHGRMRSAVGTDDTVAEEVAVAGCVFSEIAAVCPERTSVFIFLQNALVHPVPNISALQIGIFVNGLPLCPQTAGGVAHGVCVFGWHDRTVTAFFANGFKPACTGILRNEHIGIPFPLCAFVVHRAVHAFGFTVFHPKVSLIEIISVSGFITQ